MTTARNRRNVFTFIGIACALFAGSPALAQGSKIDPADTAWMISATALVLMMTIPGLALFYSGMVRKKNVLGTMAQSLAATFLVSILWVVAGYSLTFPWRRRSQKPCSCFTR
jgi:Amt family ammonium transporter